ncbi:MAG: PorT family protein [Bacteroidetes bacterium]|nr:PorT family protein [Bacteroidota bacterium]
MKRNFFLTLFFFSTTVMFAQLRADFGVKGGMNISGLALSSGGKLVGLTYNVRSGFHIGGYASIRIKKFAVQPELVYSAQGQNFTTPFYSNLNSKLNYLNVPIMLKYYLLKGLSLQAGPQFGLLLGAKGDLIQVNNGGNIGQTLMNQDLKPYLNDIDLSVGMGIGIDLPAGINLTMRYNLGITDNNKNSISNAVFPNGRQPSFSTAKTQNQVFQFSLGYRLHKIGK